MRFLRLALVATLAVGSTACFQSNTLVKLNANGSGTIDQRLMFTTAALQQMKQLGGATANGAAAAGFDPLSESSARQMADTLGPGVRYVSSTPLKTAEGEGREIQYAFDDIRTLQVSQQPPGAGGATANASMQFGFTQAAGGNSVLRIGLPNVGDLGGAVGAPAGGAAPQPAQLAMLQALLAGARITIAVEPSGRLVRTNSPYVEGNTVTLVDLPIDALFADPTLIGKLQSASTPAAAQALLSNVAGVKIPAEPEITIEFAP